MTGRPRSRPNAPPAAVRVGLTSLVQLRLTVSTLAVAALAGSAFATGRVTATCPAPVIQPPASTPAAAAPLNVGVQSRAMETKGRS